MTEFPVHDCLVLKIEEFTADKSNAHNTLYILYDKKYHNYVIRGSGCDLNFCESINDFSFVTEYVEDLRYFITFLMSRKNRFTYTLYSHNDLPIESEDITFDLLYNIDYSVRVLATHEYERYNRKRLTNNLRMLRNVFNYYN